MKQIFVWKNKRKVTFSFQNFFKKLIEQVNDFLKDVLLEMHLCAKTYQSKCIQQIFALSVTRVFTIAEILKIQSKKISNNCVLLHEFSLFYTILALFHSFFHIFTKNSNFQNMLWSYSLKAGCCRKAFFFVVCHHKSTVCFTVV